MRTKFISFALAVAFIGSAYDKGNEARSPRQRGSREEAGEETRQPLPGHPLEWRRCL